MPFREIAVKTFAFGTVSVACIGAGVLVWVGPHAATDYVNMPLAVVLILTGLGIGGLGTLLVGAILYDARIRREEAQIRVTPRGGPLGPPPAWGMSDIGRPKPGIIRVRDSAPPRVSPPGGGEGGGTRIMHIRAHGIDAPVVLVALLIWTAAFLVWLAPLHPH